MITESTTIKVVTALILPAYVTLTHHFDPTWAAIIFLGLVIGWLARVGRMLHEERSWSSIGKDTMVSLFIGGANGILASLIIFYLSAGYLQGLGIAFVCAFAGIRTLESSIKWLFNKFVGDFYKPGDDKK